MTHPIRHELTHHRYLRERLEAAFPDADDETLMDTLEGMTSLTDSLAELLRSSQEDQSLASALRSSRCAPGSTWPKPGGSAALSSDRAATAPWPPALLASAGGRSTGSWTNSLTP